MEEIWQNHVSSLVFIMEDLLQVGIISSTHGIAGEVKVFPTTDDIKRFKKLKEVILEPETDDMLLHVERVKYAKNMAVLKFAEFNNINEVQGFRGKGLYVTRDQAVPLGENEYFIADMLGLRVISTDGEDLGILKDVISTGANDVYEIRKEGEKPLLIPAIKDCIRRVDMKERTLTVYLMPGLRE